MSAAALPKLVVLLLHLGACGEAVEWAGTRDISAETLAACPRADWTEWLGSVLSVSATEPAARWIGAAKTALSGSGSGYGSGSGSGYGSGYGYGDGSGSGSGSGYGYGYGYGYGDGSGSGSGYGYGYGDGSGSGSGDGDGYGYGSGEDLISSSATCV